MTRLGYAFVAVIILFLSGGAYFGIQTVSKSRELERTQSEQQLPPPPPPDRVSEIIIQSGDTFSSALERVEIDARTAHEIVTAAEEVYDLANIRAGNMILLTYDATTDAVKQILYEISSEEELIITPLPENVWEAEKNTIQYDIEVAQAKGAISSSLYTAALEQGADEAIIIEFATVYQWTIDFGVDTQPGDEFNFIYEKRYRNGQYVDTGRVLAGAYSTRGKTYNAYFFDEDAENIGYFDASGASLKKEFLKAPVEFKYITSGFTTGLRYVSEFNVSTGHRAIDYAAAYGTPIRSVGAGTVIQAGWNGSYGNFISIRHNDTYTTNYAHLSRILVSRGQKVSQGEVIGNVGSTGFSTGPHLHYEMVKFGTKINPLREEFPPREPVQEEVMDAFLNQVAEYNRALQE